MFPWRGVDAMGDRLGDLAEVREATGTAGAVVYDPEAETASLVEVEPIGTPATWGANVAASAYVDRGRVWMDGYVNTSSGSSALGTLPAGRRPGATVYVCCTFVNDQGGTPSHETGFVVVAADGTATLSATVTLTGTLFVPLTGLSFPVAT